MSHNQPLNDIQFITDFAAFCRGKGDEEYDFDSVTQCAGAQFMRSKRSDFAEFGADGWESTSGKWHSVPDVCGQLIAAPQTFSALALRLEALLANSPIVHPIEEGEGL
jgi:hypothetical protein